MSDQNGNLYTVIRPEDGAEIPLTCTAEQLENIWLPAGYQVVGNITEETPSDKRKRPN